MTTVIADVVDQHAEEAAILWALRAAAVHSPHYLLSDLARLEGRLEAHLDGLRVNGEPGVQTIRSAARGGDPGAVFGAAVLSFEVAHPDQLESMLDAASADAAVGAGLVSAFGWLPYQQVKTAIQQLCVVDDPGRRRLGIAASAVHRQHPGVVLSRAAAPGSDNPALQARACRALGELGAPEALMAFKHHIASTDSGVRFWAAWAAAMVSTDPGAVAALQAIAEQGGPYAEEAAALAVRRLDPMRAAVWWKGVAIKPALRRVAISAAAAAGDPAAVGWLIEQMALPSVARRAGEALSLITGVHIAYDKLEGEKPEGFEAGPNDNPPDENVEMDPDDNLAWPDPKLVAKWWAAREGDYQKGTRYLLGKPMSIESANEALRNGFQRQRAAAAIELAIMQPGKPLFNVRAPAARQKKLLGL